MTLNPEIIGFAAGTLTTLCSAPQLIKIIRTESSDDVSWHTWVMAFLGTGLWIAYGLLIGSYALVVCDAIALLLTASILIKMFLINRRPFTFPFVDI